MYLLCARVASATRVDADKGANIGVGSLVKANLEIATDKEASTVATDMLRWRL